MGDRHEQPAVTGEEATEDKDFLQVVEASERAGTIVKEHVRSIVEAAEADAAEIRRRAEEDARKMRRAAVDSATRVLERMEAIEGSVGHLVADLRAEADTLTADPPRDES